MGKKPDFDVITGQAYGHMRRSPSANPSAPFPQHTLKKKRSAFLICLLAAALMNVLAAVGTLCYYLTSADSFESALLKHVDYISLGTDEESVRSFAQETIRYLSGAREGWNPQIAIGGFPASQFIPQSFREHMATVRDWVRSAKTALLAGIALALLLLGRIVAQGKKKPVSISGYYLGAFIPLAAIAGVGAWAYLDFESMWGWLHRVFIPDGIFNFAEPVMRLFPAELFADYLIPCALTYGGAVVVILALPLLLFPLSQLTGRQKRRSPKAAR